MDMIVDRPTDRPKNRITWIDCAKYCAIVAVAVDHSYTRLYQSQYIAYASYFSVTLFILLSGLSAWYSYLNRPQTVAYQLKKIGQLSLQYLFAVFIVYCYQNKSFDLVSYLGAALSFNIQAPYYFFLFFFQLLLISPLLLNWCQWCNTHRRMTATLYHLGTVIILFAFSAVSINYTSILPVHGGGKHLLGGTYLPVYYIGVLFGNCKLFQLNNVRFYRIMLCVSAPLWVVWVFLMKHQILPIDDFLSPLFGLGFNPPSFEFITFAILSLFLFYSLFSLLERSNTYVFSGTVKVISILGKYTLYIFMYHLLVQDVIMRLLPDISSSHIFVRGAAFLAIVNLPAAVAMLWHWIKKKCRLSFRHN